MIDSVVYMKMRALTSLTALKIKDIVVPSPFSYKCCSVWRELEHQPQEMEHQNTTVHPVLSKLFLSVQAHDYNMQSEQATMRCKHDTEERGVLEKDLEAILDLNVTMNWRKDLFLLRVTYNETT